MGLTDQAETALPAGSAPGQDDMVAGSDVGDALAHLLHDGRALVPEQERKSSVPKTPFFAERSVWQTPLARMRTSASPGPGGSMVNSSSTPGSPGSRAMTPRATIDPLPVIPDDSATGLLLISHLTSRRDSRSDDRTDSTRLLGIVTYLHR